jgi:hypothetical protein
MQLLNRHVPRQRILKRLVEFNLCREGIERLFIRRRYRLHDVSELRYRLFCLIGGHSIYDERGVQRCQQ